MRRFAFLVHPRSEEDIHRLERNLGSATYEEIRSSWRAFRYQEINYAGAHGAIYVVPLTTAQMEKLPRAFSRAKVLEAAQLAVDEGAAVIGLGGMTSVVTRAGQWLCPRLDALVVNGNALTSACVAEQVRSALEAKSIPALVEQTDIRIGIVGGAGAVGLGCARLLGGHCRELTLFGRYQHHLAQARLSLTSSWDVGISNRLRELKGSQVVVLATASSAPVLYREYLTAGTVVYDLTEPCNLAPCVVSGACDGDLAVFRTGQMRATGVDLSWMDGQIAREKIYACLAEALVFALDDSMDSHSVKPSDGDAMRGLLQSARHFGLTPCSEPVSACKEGVHH